MVDPNLVTTCNFHGQDFLFKMNVLGNNLEILVTDKNSGEEWQCSYDATCEFYRKGGLSLNISHFRYRELDSQNRKFQAI